MRIDQLQKLFFAGNVLLFAGMGYVGWLFFGAQQARGQLRQPEWPENVKVTGTVNTGPPPLAQFAVIHNTPVDGLVPPPPVKGPAVTEVKRDVWGDFKRQIVYRGGWIWPDPSKSIISFEFPKGTELTLRLGQKIGGNWQFVGFRSLERGSLFDPEKIELSFKFVGADGGSEPERNQTFTDVFTGPKPEFDAAKLEPFKPSESDLVSFETVDENNLSVQTYRATPDAPWSVPRAEVQWWRAYGERGFIAAKATFVPAGDANPAGVAFESSLNAHRALVGERGIYAGDLVTAIDGTAVGSVNELLRYFQAAVPGVSEFTLTVQNAGQERQERYVLPVLRHRAASE